MSEDDPLLCTGEAAARGNIKPRTWTKYVKRGYAPPPDDPGDQTLPLNLRRRRWRASTVDTYLKTRPGQGRRTDLVNARAGQRRRDAADLAEPVSSPSPDLAAWLRANHTALLRVADVLVDARAMLMAASFRPELLAEAIDAAGERMTRGPSKAFASAVTYAMGLVQRLPLDRDSDIAIVLHQHGHLRAEFEPYAGPIS